MLFNGANLWLLHKESIQIISLLEILKSKAWLLFHTDFFGMWDGSGSNYGLDGESTHISLANPEHVNLA